MIDGNPDDFEAISGIFTAETLEKGDLPPAGLAPGRPEIHREQPAPPVREGVRDACQVREREVRQSLRYGVGLRALLRGGGGGLRRRYRLDARRLRRMVAAEEKTGGPKARENPHDRQHGGGRASGAHGGD